MYSMHENMANRAVSFSGVHVFTCVHILIEYLLHCSSPS